jgi:hypothetical protein
MWSGLAVGNIAGNECADQMEAVTRQFEQRAFFFVEHRWRSLLGDPPEW